MKRFWLILALLAAAPAYGAAPALASCATSGDLEDAVAQAGVLFVATATSTNARGTEAEMDVIAIWKGPDLPETVTIDGATGEELSLHRRFVAGQTYLVFPLNYAEPFQDNQCTATRAYTTTGLAIPPYLVDVVGEETARPPIATVEASAEGGLSATPVLIAVGGGILLYGAFVGTRRWRARRADTGLAQSLMLSRVGKRPGTERLAKDLERARATKSVRKKSRRIRRR